MTAIDLSSWQGHPDFVQVAASGVTLVILKAVDVERGYPVVDSVYLVNRAAARAAGLRVGSYLFNGPDQPSAAADYYLSVIDWRPGDVAAVDVENALGVNRWNPGQVLEFCTRLVSRGIPASSILVYMSSSVTRAYDWAPVVAFGVGLWVAQYNANDGTVGAPPTVSYWPGWVLWQHTSMARVPGVSGTVDMNVIGSTFASVGTAQLITTPQPIELGDPVSTVYFKGDKSDSVFALNKDTGKKRSVSSSEFAVVSSVSAGTLPNFGSMSGGGLIIVPQAAADAIPAG